MNLHLMISKIRRNTSQATKNFFVYGLVLLILSTIFTCFLYVALNMTASALSSGVNPNTVFLSITQISMGIFLDNIVDPKDQKFVPLTLSLANNVTFLASGQMLIISFWSAVKSKFFDTEKRRIATHEISDEKDAFPILEKYYKESQEVHAFSGDYSFLLSHTGLCSAIVSLAEAGRLKMYSYKTIQDIESKFSANSESKVIFEKIRPYIIPNHPTRIKASFIKGNGTKLFLYASEEFHADGGKIKKICAVMSRDEMQNLLDIMENLILFNGNHPRTDSRDHERASLKS